MNGSASESPGFSRGGGSQCLDRIRRAGVHDEDCRVVRQWLEFDRLISDRQEES